MKQEPKYDFSIYRRLGPNEIVRRNDRWFDFDDGKWWEFFITGSGLPAKEYKFVIRRIKGAQ